MEHSERGRYVTNQVLLWIENDPDHVHEARENAKYSVRGMEQFLTRLILHAREGDAAHHVQQELAGNDFDRVDWDGIAASLRE